MLKLYKSRKDFHDKFICERDRLHIIIGKPCNIEHVGSTAVPNLDGKGIIDILIGFDSVESINSAVKELISHGYYNGRTKTERVDQVFLASSEADTVIGDIHLHLAIKNSDYYNNYIKIRDYLCQNPNEAKRYSNLKKSIAEQTGFDRDEYKKQKSEFVEKILMKQ